MFKVNCKTCKVWSLVIFLNIRTLLYILEPFLIHSCFELFLICIEPCVSFCRMPFKRKHVPGGLKQQRRVDKLRKAVRLARQEKAAREARFAVGAQSAPVGVPGRGVSEVGMSDVQMSQAEGSADSTPAARPITAEDLVAVITGVLQAQQAQQPPPLPPPPPPPPAPVVRSAASIITDFVRIAPPTFTGEGDPILAEKWEEQILKHLDALEVKDDATRIRLATFQFRDSAESWWTSIKDTRDVSKLAWKEFSSLFLDRFFPMVVQEQKRKEFATLLQRTMSVTEYEIKFTSLSRFAKDMVAEEKWKCRKFEEGLVPDIAELVVVHAYTNYRALVDGALRAERQLAETKRIKSGRTGSTGGA